MGDTSILSSAGVHQGDPLALLTLLSRSPAIGGAPGQGDPHPGGQCIGQKDPKSERGRFQVAGGSYWKSHIRG